MRACVRACVRVCVCVCVCVCVLQTTDGLLAENKINGAFKTNSPLNNFPFFQSLLPAMNGRKTPSYLQGGLLGQNMSFL